MLPFKLIYSEDYYLPIGAHVFPAQKYRWVHRRLLETKIAEDADFIEPTMASDEDILQIHTREYVQKLKTATLSAQEETQLEIPYSPELVKAFWLAAGGSMLAADLALKDRVAFNIGGGFHHAYPNHGEGFCAIHDVAVAIRRLQADRVITRAIVVDTDVHHGNGTAAIFGNDPSVFTLSIHQEKNYPAHKPPSTVDINMWDRADDSEYLDALMPAVEKALDEFRPDMLFYIGGADPFCEDQLGGLSLTKKGLLERDRRTFELARQRNIPVVTALAGGYARRVEDTVRIHINTIVAARDVVLAFPRSSRAAGE